MCPSMHLTLSVHLVNGRVYWALTHRDSGGLGRIVARGTIEEPMPSLYHSPGTHLMEAAYEAYRQIGD